MMANFVPIMKIQDLIPYSDGSSIKSIQYYSQAFDEIEKADFSNSNFEEMKYHIEKEMQIPLIQYLRPNIRLNNQPLYRIRKCSGFNENKTYSNAFGAPPILQTKKGRANLPYYPVLYLSFLPQTACAECNVSIGEEIFISSWQFLDSDICGNFYLGNRTFMHPSWEDIITKNEKIMEKKFSCYNSNVKSAIHYINDRLMTWFLKDDKNYPHSSFLAHYSLYDTDLSKYNSSVDCILYPSVENVYKNANIAVGAKSLHKIHLKTVTHGRLSEISNEGIKLEPIEVGICKNDRVFWSNNF